ncbi:MAG: TonB family protein [Spirochaetia bacterium]|nr:TonB family protein [Spirochaetia bacterium]
MTFYSNYKNYISLNIPPKRKELYTTINKKYFKNSFITSILLHTIFILLLYFTQEQHPIQISFNIKLLNTEKRIPKKVKEEIETKLKTIKEKVEIKKKNAVSNESLKSEKPVDEKIETVETLAPAPKSAKKNIKDEMFKSTDEFASDFEKTLFTKKSLKKVITGSQAQDKEGGDAAKNWEEEGKETISTEKTGTTESVKIPSGKTGKGSIVWKSGYKRNLDYIPDIPYPKYYRERGIQAKIILDFEVNSAGKVINVNIKQSSGYTKLDILAKEAVRKAKFTAIPGVKNLSSDAGEIEIHFELTR